MTYSCADYNEDVFRELCRVGAITTSESNDPEAGEHTDIQATLSLAGIGRLVAVKDAFVGYRRALEELAKRKGFSLQDGAFCEADERAKKALADFRTTDLDTNLNTMEVFSGFFSYEDIALRAEFQVPMGATVGEKDAAFLAALAQQANVEYLAIGTERTPVAVALTADNLEAEFGQEHPDWPIADWRQDVFSGDTKLGYWLWVLHNVEAAECGE